MHRLLTRLAPNHHVHHRHRTPPGWISPLLRNFLPPPKPGTLILVRHGESEWNSEKKFTGWTDVDLNARGKREVEHAARLLLERGYTVDGAWCGVVLFLQPMHACVMLIVDTSRPPPPPPTPQPIQQSPIRPSSSGPSAVRGF